MKVLITGASGQVGSHITKGLVHQGYRLRLLDQVEPREHPAEAEVLIGKIEDAKLVQEAVAGVDVILHLAWSFRDRVPELLQSDIAGLVNLLEGAVMARVRKIVLASSCVVYGRPITLPVNEDHPCAPETGRKPAYGVCKLFTEQLCRVYHREAELSYTILRFWWAFGTTIGGRHLKAMIKDAQNTQTIAVPRGTGGSFLHLDDFTQAFGLAATDSRTDARIYNLATVYVSWSEVAEMIAGALGGSVRVHEVDTANWTGPGFFLEDWPLDTQRYDKIRPTPPRSREAAMDLFYRAIRNTVNEVMSEFR
ncbi:MAG: NAD(P)-dependent oxidoreductase [Bacillota bacterium]